LFWRFCTIYIIFSRQGNYFFLLDTWPHTSPGNEATNAAAKGTTIFRNFTLIHALSSEVCAFLHPTISSWQDKWTDNFQQTASCEAIHAGAAFLPQFYEG
jgi:hypothetical protein